MALGRLYGVPLPAPRALPLDRAAEVARWIARTLRSDGRCLFNPPVSIALRVSVAARQEGLDLMGAAFFGGGEPPTPAKVRQITASGARWIPVYGSQEAGVIGLGCASPADGNDVHHVRDTLALIQHPRQVPGSALTVPAFHLTGLAPSFPRVMLNMESDDYGVLETRACGCPLEALDYPSTCGTCTASAS